jgi:hypothetical protein
MPKKMKGRAGCAVGRRGLACIPGHGFPDPSNSRTAVPDGVAAAVFWATGALTPQVS